LQNDGSKATGELIVTFQKRKFRNRKNNMKPLKASEMSELIGGESYLIDWWQDIDYDGDWPWEYTWKYGKPYVKV